jgi:hypothetical protein
VDVLVKTKQEFQTVAELDKIRKRLPSKPALLQALPCASARAISSLRTMFEFSENVVLILDWELCLGLLDAVMEADAVVVIDGPCSTGKDALQTLGADATLQAPFGCLDNFLFGERGFHF